MGVIYKLNDNIYHEVLKSEGLKGKKENEVNIIFYNDKIEIKELDVTLKLNRKDIKNIKEEEHTIIETMLGYDIIILDGVVQNKKVMREYLNFYIKEQKSIDEKTIRVDTLNGISTIKINNSTIEFDLREVEKITEDDENIYFLNKTILFEKIKLPKFIFEGKEDKERFLKSLKFNKIKIKRVMKRLFLK